MLDVETRYVGLKWWRDQICRCSWSVPSSAAGQRRHGKLEPGWSQCHHHLSTWISTSWWKQNPCVPLWQRRTLASHSTVWRLVRL